MGTACNQNSLISLGLQILEIKIGADGGIQLDFHPKGPDEIDLGIQDIPGEPVIRDSQGQHTACHGHGLEYGDQITLQCQIMGRCQPCRPRADNGDPLLARWGLLQMGLNIILECVISHKAFQGGNGHGLFYLSPLTYLLTGVCTYAAADYGYRIVLLDQVECLCEFLLLDQGNIPLGVLSERAGQFARGFSLLINGILVGDGLCKGFVNRLPSAQALFEFIGDLHRALLLTITASVAPGLINIPRML